MKKKYSDFTVLHSDNFDEFIDLQSLPFPFDKEFVNLLKKGNLFKQEYYYIKNKQHFAFFILYKMKLDIFTFGKFNLKLDVQVIGIPCSISENGYITNNEKMMFEFIKTIKGPKLILNTKETTNIKNFTSGHTLPTCVFQGKFNSINEYTNSLRSSYRRRINKAIKNCEDVQIEYIDGDFPSEFYELYLATYMKSPYKLEKLEPVFFNEVKGEKIVFKRNNIPIGFVLLRKHGQTLFFVLCGMNYAYETADLYHFMLYSIIDFSIKNNCKYIDFGQTSEETKMKMGCTISHRYFYVHHSNRLLNWLFKCNKNLFEYKYNFKNFRVFKGETHGNITDTPQTS